MPAMMTENTIEAIDYSPLRTLTRLGSVTWQRKSLVLLGLAVALVLGGLLYSQTPPVYQSAAQVLVVKKRPDVVMPNPADQRAAYVEDYLATHVILIQSDEVLQRAAKLVEADTLNVPPTGGDVMALLKSGLMVLRDKDVTSGPTNILNLTLRHISPADCPRLLAAVIDGYRTFLGDAYSSLNDETLKLIENARQILEKDLARKQADYQRICQRNPLALKAKDGVHMYQERINRIESRRSTLSLRQKEIEARQTMIAKSLREGQSRAAVLALLTERETASAKGSPDVAPTLEGKLVELQLLLDEARQTYGDNHPQVMGLRRRLDSLRERLGKADPGEKPVDPLDVHIQSLKAEHEENKLLLAVLEPELEAEQRDGQALARFLIEEEEARNEVNRVRQLYDAVIDRLRQINLTREAGGFEARVVTPPKAGAKVAPSLLTHLALALVAGLGLGLGLACLADFTDTSFRSPQEIRLRLGLTVFGHVPYFAPDESGDSLTLERVAAEVVAFHRPRSPGAEAFRGVRTALYFSTRGRGHQVIQVTSAVMGEGKSTIVANLAASIAQSGRRAVLIDADFRRPRQHRLFPTVNRKIGLASVIAGDTALEAAVQETGVPGLWLLPCGPRPANPAELLTDPRFKEVLAALRTRFDFVLVDSPPVLVVSDPSVVAPQVDGVLLVVRIAKRNRTTAERTLEALEALDANILGVLVNDADGGTLNYGDGYGYGYRYGNRYGYRYAPVYGEPAETDVALTPRAAPALPAGDPPPAENDKVTG